MSQTIPSTHPLGPEREARAVPAGPTSLFPFLRPPVEEDEIGRLGGYRILRLLAEGGMGKVYLAEDIALRRPAALKVIQPNLEQTLPGACERFLREARAMASIQHDNLVTVYAAGQDGDTVYLAMELLQGETLERRIGQAAPLPAAEVIRIGREIAAGLAAVHDRGLVHRDIKPANLWLEAPSGRVKILDFGLVRGSEGEQGLTQIGMIVGTPAYMSPEQIRGEAFDHRADLFSLGCVLFRMCTNAVPFPATTPMAQLTAVVVDDPTPVTDLNPAVPPALAALVMQLIDKDAARRPASAAEVVQQLVWAKREQARASGKSRTERLPRAKATAPITPGPIIKPARRAPAPARRPRWVWAALAAAVVVPLTVAGLLSLRKPDPRNDDHRPGPTAGRPAPADRPSGALSPALPPAKKSERKYLSDLEKVDPSRSFQRAPLPPGFTGEIFVRGQPAAHGIFMHPAPPELPPTSLGYRLGGAYARVSGEVSFNDSAPPRPAPAVFTIFGDGQLLWRSPEVRSQDQAARFDVVVTNVDLLILEVHALGDVRGCHAVWVDPVLTK